MFGRKKALKENVKAVCGYKDSQGVIWDTYEKAVESTEEHKRVKEEREMVEEVVECLVRARPSLRYDLRSMFRHQSKEIYSILHKYYGKEGL